MNRKHLTLSLRIILLIYGHELALFFCKNMGLKCDIDFTPYYIAVLNQKGFWGKRRQAKYDFRNKETDNSRNDFNSKTLHTSYGDMELDVPRDRNEELEPKIVKKYQNTLIRDMEKKIKSMYAKGMTTGDIESHMQELYGVDISDSTSRITDKILPVVKE